MFLSLQIEDSGNFYKYNFEFRFPLSKPFITEKIVFRIPGFNVPNYFNLKISGFKNFFFYLWWC